MQILTVTGFYGQSRANILGDENVIEYCNIAETIRPCTVLESCNLFPASGDHDVRRAVSTEARSFKDRYGITISK